MFQYYQSEFPQNNQSLENTFEFRKFYFGLFNSLIERLHGQLNPYCEYLRNNTQREIFIVGGALRNLAWGLPVKDWDLIVNCATSREVSRLSRQFCDFSGASWVILDDERGFYRAVFNQQNIEIDFCTRRGESLAQDLQDRDFTINALAYSINTGVLYDLGLGISDLWQRRLSLVSANSLGNDPLRALRAIRFALVYSLTLTDELDSALASFLRCGLPQIAGERIIAELVAILNLPLAKHKLQLQKWAFDKFLEQDWSGKRIFSEMELSLWDMLVCLEEEQRNGWSMLRHSGLLLQKELNKSPKGGRNFLVLLKLYLLSGTELLSSKRNRFKLSAAELKVIKEAGSATYELSRLLFKQAERREFYYFFHRVKFFFVAAALNCIWLSCANKALSLEKFLTTEVKQVGAGKRASAENSKGGVFSIDKYASGALYLDCLLLDYLKGGAVSKPIVPADGYLLQKKLGIEPGPRLGRILQELAAECSQGSMSEEEALSWVQNRLSQDIAF